MPHFKRSGPKSTRAGCLLCKPHKHQGAKGKFNSQTLQERRALLSEEDEEEPHVSSQRKRGPKRFLLEKRELGPEEEPICEWFVYRRYRTQAGLDAALKSLRASTRGYRDRWGGRVFEEFRAHPENLSDDLLKEPCQPE